MKLYVGTYAKYNAGDLCGAWVDLNKFKCKAEFLEACRKIHKNERDPDYMFQDCECTEDWEKAFYDESYIDPKYWEVLKDEQEKAKKPKKRNADKEEQYSIMARIGVNENDMAYCFRNGHYVDIHGIVVCVDKPSIETSFCFDDEMEDCHKMCKEVKTHDYFVSENMGKFKTDDELEKLKVYVFPNQYSNAPIWDHAIEEDTHDLECNHILPYDRINRTAKYLQFQKDYVELSGDDREHFLAEYRKAREMFRGRCETWYRRFGAEKIRTWTYWANA